MNRATTLEKIFFTLAIIFSFLAALFWLTTSRQPLIDMHSFRQAQTAITSLYLHPSIKGLVNYETPVLGSPWSIPFEFPLYQFLVYWIARISLLPLDTAGRLLSALFGLLCIFPAKGLMKLFRVRKNGQYCFYVLYFSSSIYLYWNRTFMIESTALFLTLSSLYLYAKIRLPSEQFDKSLKDTIVEYSIFIMVLLLGLLTKVTTILPAFMLIAFDLSTNIIFSLPFFGKSSQISRLNLFLCSICLIVSFAIFKTWLLHADSLKSMNQIGQFLTSDALTNWNYGDPNQRIGRQLWGKVVILRMMTPTGFVPGIFLIGASIFASLSKQKACKIETVFILVCICLWLTPLVLFTNLHIWHTYYQCANQVFLLLALAASFSTAIELFNNPRLKRLIILSLCVFVAGSLIDFSYSSQYLKASFLSDSDKLKAGRFLQQNTPSESVILVIGDDWSSAFSYYSKRRSLTLPDLQKLPELQKVYTTPQAALDRSSEWLGGNPLGAIVESENNQQQLSKALSCNPKTERKFGGWNLSICT